MTLVSVIIPTLNSEKTIGNCLQSIMEQSHKEIEVYVVDSFSQDNTKEICRKFELEFIELEAERSRAKNSVLKSLNSEYVLFVDSDMILSAEVISQCVCIAERGGHNMGGVVIPEITFGNGLWVKIRNLERNRYQNTEVESARFFRTEVAKDCMGFDEDLIFFEEATLPIKMKLKGYNIGRIETHILHDESNFDLAKWLKKKYYYGKTLNSFTKRYASSVHSPKYRLRILINFRLKVAEVIPFIFMLQLKLLEYISMQIGNKFSKR